MGIKDLYPFETIILGSKSPRRKQLLEAAGLEVILTDANVEEIFPNELPAMDVPAYLADLKMSAIKSQANTKEIIVTADTIVIHNGDILGKPKSIAEAKSFLRRMSNDTHQVVTAVCLKSAKGQMTFSEVAEVRFESISESEIDFYVNHYEVMDKAGAYGIQDWIGLTKISKIVGDYHTIVGLPVASLIRHAIDLF